MLISDNDTRDILTLSGQGIPCHEIETLITAMRPQIYALVILEANIAVEGKRDLLPSWVLIRVAARLVVRRLFSLAFQVIGLDTCYSITHSQVILRHRVLVMI